MKLNQNVLSPYNNFNKVDATMVACIDAQNTMQTAEFLLDYYLRNSSMPSDDSMDNKLRYLDRKIEATRKTISSWESYRISAVAAGEEELRQQLGALQPTTGLVINSLESATININNQSYARGDIIFKDINNQQHHIPSYSGGYYYPTTIEPTGANSSSYILSYTYATSAPATKSSSNLSSIALNAPAETIMLTFSPATTSGSYGHREAIKTNSGLQEGIEMIEDMQPVVAWYLTTNETSGKGERVYFDEEYTITDDVIQCYNRTSFESLWVEVR